MSHRIPGILDKTADHQPILPFGAVNLKVSKEKRRFPGVLFFLVVIGTILRAFRGSKTIAGPSDVGNKIRSSNMANELTSAAASRAQSGEGEGRSLLNTVLEQNGSVESETDDLFERAASSDREEFRRTFENEVSGLRGFSTSIRTLVGR